MTDEDAIDALTWYADGDGDALGDPAAWVTACSVPDAHLADASDCDDTDAQINPDAAERCNGADDDCDGTIDEVDAADADTRYAVAYVDGGDYYADNPARAGDIDGDGLDDLIVYDDRLNLLFADYGPFVGNVDLSTAPIRYEFPSCPATLVGAAGVGDTNGDGPAMRRRRPRIFGHGECGRRRGHGRNAGRRGRHQSGQGGVPGALPPPMLGLGHRVV